jgi:hypothetical protein
LQISHLRQHGVTTSLGEGKSAFDQRIAQMCWVQGWICVVFCHGSKKRSTFVFPECVRKKSPYFAVPLILQENCFCRVL